MKIDLPQSVIEQAIMAHHIQMGGSRNSTETRCLEVQRIEKHIAEIVSAIIIRQYIKSAKQIK